MGRERKRSLKRLTHQTSKELDRKEQKKEKKKRKEGGGDVSWRRGRRGRGGMLWSGALLIALLSSYTSIIYLCTHSSLLLTRQCHFIPEAGIEFSKKVEKKEGKFETRSALVWGVKKKTHTKNKARRTKFAIQYIHSRFKLNSPMLLVTKAGIISDIGKYLF